MTREEQLLHIMGALDGGSARVMGAMIGGSGKDNIIHGTYEEIARRSGVSRQKATWTIKRMEEWGLLVRVEYGYMLSPMLKGLDSREGRELVMEYRRNGGKLWP